MNRLLLLPHRPWLMGRCPISERLVQLARCSA